MIPAHTRKMSPTEGLTLHYQTAKHKDRAPRPSEGASFRWVGGTFLHVAWWEPVMSADIQGLRGGLRLHDQVSPERRGPALCAGTKTQAEGRATE